MRYASLLFFLALADGQQPTATLEGQVLNAATGEPLRKAHLMLRGAGGRSEAPWAATTDAAGRFSIAGVPPGRYYLSAERNGFVRTEYGARRPGRAGAALTLAAGQTLKDVSFKLIPHAVVAGRVLDEDGEPVARAMVRAFRHAYIRGRRQFAPAGTDMTDDRGEYRIHGLAPGKYFVSAVYRGFGEMWRANERTENADEGYVPVYYPNTTDPAAAAPLEATPGGILAGIDMALTRAQTVRISGRVVYPAGQRPPRSIFVFLMPRDLSALAVERPGAPAQGPEGRFDLRGVVPGAYVLAAELYEDGKRMSARLPIEVGNANLTGVQLQLSPALEVAGSVRVDGQPPPKFEGLQVYTQPRGGEGAGMGFGGGRVNADGTFRIANAGPDTVSVAVSGLQENYYVRAIRLGEQELPDNSVNLGGAAGARLEVVLSPNGAQVEGVAVNAEKQPVAAATVVLIPDARRRDRMDLFKTATTDQNGHFTLRGIPPGDYTLFAWEDVEAGAWQDPDFLKPLENQGQTLRLKESSRENVQVNVVPGG